MKDDKIKREPVCMSTTRKCYWCKKRSAVITDGAYVYCSNNCKKEFIKNAEQAMNDKYGGIIDNYDENR